jgi:hypothetical protein
MAYYQGTRSQTHIDHGEFMIEGDKYIYSHFVEDLVGSRGHYPCEVNLSTVSGDDKLTLVLEGDEKLKVALIGIGSNWIRDDKEYTSAMISLIEHIASDERYREEWIERANVRDFMKWD